jgi:hypothetical protein
MNRPADKKNHAAGNRNGCLTRAVCWLAAAICFVGGLQAADSVPDNVFASPQKLSPNLHRVALLPLTAETPDADLPQGCEALQPVLLAELLRTKSFEIVTVTADILRSRSGRRAWTGAEVLPAGFFDSLQREYGCDAVMFCQLTVYRAYAPMVVGWRLKLVDVRTRAIIWAADQMFDASQPATAGNAWKFLAGRNKSGSTDEGRWVAMNSPRLFGHYTAAAILGTLPER